MQAETTIDILRHGACEGGEIYRGSTDVALSSEGFEQMQASAKRVHQDWHHIVHSPLKRCAIFARQLANEQNISISEHEGFKETHFGEWEGQLVKEIWDKRYDEVSAWLENPLENPPPNGEPTDIFMARVANAFDDICQRYKGQHIGVVTHGGVIRVLLAHILQSSFNGFSRMQVPYACLSRISVLKYKDRSFPQLVFHNVS